MKTIGIKLAAAAAAAMFGTPVLGVLAAEGDLSLSAKDANGNTVVVDAYGDTYTLDDYGNVFTIDPYGNYVNYSADGNTWTHAQDGSLLSVTPTSDALPLPSLEDASAGSPWQAYALDAAQEISYTTDPGAASLQNSVQNNIQSSVLTDLASRTVTEAGLLQEENSPDISYTTDPAFAPEEKKEEALLPGEDATDPYSIAEDALIDHADVFTYEDYDNSAANSVYTLAAFTTGDSTLFNTTGTIDHTDPLQQTTALHPAVDTLYPITPTESPESFMTTTEEQQAEIIDPWSGYETQQTDTLYTTNLVDYGVNHEEEGTLYSNESSWQDDYTPAYGLNVSLQPDFSNQAWNDPENPFNTEEFWGQCTWFSWCRFKEIYGYNPGFYGDGWQNAAEIVNNYPANFALEKTPVSGAVFSSDPAHNHTGIVLWADEAGQNMVIQEGNLDGISNDYYTALQDYCTRTLSLDQLRSNYGDVVFANPTVGNFSMM